MAFIVSCVCVDGVDYPKYLPLYYSIIIKPYQLITIHILPHPFCVNLRVDYPKYRLLYYSIVYPLGPQLYQIITFHTHTFKPHGSEDKDVQRMTCAFLLLPLLKELHETR